MNRPVHHFLVLIVLSCMCGALSAHERPESVVEWVRTIRDLDKFEKDTKSIALDIRKDGDRSLVDAVVMRFPNVRKLKVHYFHHKVHQSVFESLGKLKELRSLEVSGDARLSERDFEFIGRMTHLEGLSFSLP